MLLLRISTLVEEMQQGKAMRNFPSRILSGSHHVRSNNDMEQPHIGKNEKKNMARDCWLIWY